MHLRIKTKNFYDAKIKIGYFVIFQIHWNLISFADIGIINFHNFLWPSTILP